MRIQWFGHFDLEPQEVMDRLLGGAGDNPALPAGLMIGCLLYTSPSPRDLSTSRMPSSA